MFREGSFLSKAGFTVKYVTYEVCLEVENLHLHSST